MKQKMSLVALFMVVFGYLCLADPSPWDDQSFKDGTVEIFDINIDHHYARYQGAWRNLRFKETATLWIQQDSLTTADRILNVLAPCFWSSPEVRGDRRFWLITKQGNVYTSHDYGFEIPYVGIQPDFSAKIDTSYIIPSSGWIFQNDSAYQVRRLEVDWLNMHWAVADTHWHTWFTRWHPGADPPRLDTH